MNANALEIPVAASAPIAGQADTQTPTQSRTYGGVGRGGYFLGMIGICLLEFAVGAATHGEPMVGLLTVIVTLALSIFLVAKRLQNIGMSGWFALLGLVPVIGMIVGIRCLMMPEGYAQSHKLDATAKNILGIIISFLVLVVLLAAMAAFAN